MTVFEDRYEDLTEALVAIAPEGWWRVGVAGSALDDFASARFFYERDGGLENSFFPGTHACDYIAQLLVRLRERMEEPDEPPWDRVWFSFERSGKYQSRFDFDVADD